MAIDSVSLEEGALPEWSKSPGQDDRLSHRGGSRRLQIMNQMVCLMAMPVSIRKTSAGSNQKQFTTIFMASLVKGLMIGIIPPMDTCSVRLRW
jgi:hypothetical protein